MGAAIIPGYGDFPTPTKQPSLAPVPTNPTPSLPPCLTALLMPHIVGRKGGKKNQRWQKMPKKRRAAVKGSDVAALEDDDMEEEVRQWLVLHCSELNISFKINSKIAVLFGDRTLTAASCAQRPRVKLLSLTTAKMVRKIILEVVVVVVDIVLMMFVVLVVIT